MTLTVIVMIKTKLIYCCYYHQYCIGINFWICIIAGIICRRFFLIVVTAMIATHGRDVKKSRGRPGTLSLPCKAGFQHRFKAPPTRAANSLAHAFPALPHAIFAFSCHSGGAGNRAANPRVRQASRIGVDVVIRCLGPYLWLF